MSTGAPAALLTPGVISDILRRLATVEQQLGTANGSSEQLQPNYLTIDPDGTVSADFTGTVTAEDLILPGADKSDTAGSNSISWTQGVGGAQLAFVSGHSDGQGGVILESLVGPNGVTTAFNWVGAENESGGQALLRLTADPNSSSVASIDALVGGDDGALIQDPTIIDAKGVSSFLQLVVQKRLLLEGPFSVNISAGAQSWGAGTFQTTKRDWTWMIPLGGIAGQPVTPAFWSSAPTPSGLVTIYIANNSAYAGGYSWSGFAIGY